MIEPIELCANCKGECRHCTGFLTRNGKPGRPRLFCCKPCRNSRYNYSFPKPDYGEKECVACKGACKTCKGQIPLGPIGKLVRIYCCATCRESCARQDRQAALAAIPLKSCESCRGECQHCDGLQASSRAKYCCDNCKRIARDEKALEMQRFYDTICYNKAAVKRIFGGTAEDYLGKYYRPKVKQP